MTLEHLLNKYYTTYRESAAATYPYDNVWAVNVTGRCYLSSNKMQRVSDAGALIKVTEYRIRMVPADVVKGDRIVVDSEVYEVMEYEDIDKLGREAVAFTKLLPGTVAQELTA